MPTLASPLASPLFEGGGLSSDVPGKFDAALNGINLMVDWKYAASDEFKRQSVQLRKPQQDTSGLTSEASLNPEDHDRRSAESWHHGAGNTFHDRNDSDPSRFRTSKGVDVWTKNQLSLLNDTTKKRNSTETNLRVATAGDHLYLTTSYQLLWTTDLTSWNTTTGGSGNQDIRGIASDGYFIYYTDSTDGIYYTTPGAAAVSSYNPREAHGICAYVKGRLIIADRNVLVNITSGSTEKILLTHPNTEFEWTDAGEGPGFIYACGFVGDKGTIYKTAILAEGTDLATLTVAGELPDGEIPRSVEGYLGFLLVGTDKGLRLVQLDASGNVASMGKVIPTASPVYALEPQDRYVWYGLSDYDDTSTGLGRADLGEFTDSLTPAYASDLMATAQGAVQSAATFLNTRVFTVSGSGVWAENTASLVASGHLDGGLVTYGLPDTKIGMSIDSRFAPLAGSVTVALSSDGGPFVSLQTTDVAGSTMMETAMGEPAAETFETRLTLARDAVATEGPVYRRWTMEANPAPGRGEVFTVPFMLFDTVDTLAGKHSMNVRTTYRQLVSIEAQGRPVPYQDLFGRSTVFLDDHVFVVDSRSENNNGYQGTFVARLRKPGVKI